MNNYCLPKEIKLINRLDLIIGIIALSLVSYDISLGENFVQTSKVACFTGIMLIVYCIVCITKIVMYIRCSFQCYRMSLVGISLYILWTVFMALLSIVFLVSRLPMM